MRKVDTAREGENTEANSEWKAVRGGDGGDGRWEHGKRKSLRECCEE